MRAMGHIGIHDLQQHCLLKLHVTLYNAHMHLVLNIIWYGLHNPKLYIYKETIIWMYFGLINLETNNLNGKSSRGKKL